MCIGWFSFAFKFEFVTFKRNLKWGNAWNKSWRFRHFEQLSYSKFLKFPLKILRNFKVNSLTFLSFSLSPSRPWLLCSRWATRARTPARAAPLPLHRCARCLAAILLLPLAAPRPGHESSPHATAGHKSRTSARRRALDAAGHQCRAPRSTRLP